MRRHRFGRSDVFADDLVRVERRRARPAIGDHEIDAERYRQTRACQSFGDYSCAIVRQAVMHDDALVVGQAPQPGLRVAVGWIDGKRPDLDGTEAEVGKGRDRRAALVEAGGKSNRWWEIQ